MNINTHDFVAHTDEGVNTASIDTSGMVSVNGIQMPKGVALEHGLIDQAQHDADKLSNLQAQLEDQQKAAAESTHEDNEPGWHTPGPEKMEAIQGAMDLAGSEVVQHSIIQQAAESGEFDVPEDMVSRMAEQTGLSPDEVSAQMDSARTAYSEHASWYLQSVHGIEDGPAFVESMMSNPGTAAEFQAATRVYLASGDPSVYEGLARKHSGAQYGNQLVTVHGMQMLASQAREMGLI